MKRAAFGIVTTLAHTRLCAESRSTNNGDNSSNNYCHNRDPYEEMRAAQGG